MRRVLVVGSGTRFLSGISYYTSLLSGALAQEHDVSVICMRNLIPRVFYPGRARVGAPIMGKGVHPDVPTFDGINWTLFPSLLRAINFAKRANPEVMILQWWSASALVAYLALARFAERRNINIVLEFHETLDTAEARLALIGPLIWRGLHRLIAKSSAFVVHSQFDFEQMTEQFGLPQDKTFIIPLGPFTMVTSDDLPLQAPSATQTILFFGTIRPYKGLEFLVEAFDLLPRTEINWKLLIVGETWEGWTLPFTRIDQSPFRHDIEVINRYVTDEELPAFFGAASLVALPYLRSSASGPLHLAMSAGLPVVVTEVGGLSEASANYDGKILVKPHDAEDLARGIVEAHKLVGQRFGDPQSWDHSRQRFNDLFTQLFHEGKRSETAEDRK